MKKTTIINILTVALAVLELFAAYFLHAKSFIDNLIDICLGANNGLIDFIGLITPMGLLHIINYKILSPVIYLIGACIWRFLGHYRYIENSIQSIISSSINWLIDCDVHWGPLNHSTEWQNANTCEVLIALQKSGFHRKKSNIYKESLKAVFNNVVDDGLPSKSLGRATVVCTSMLLYLVGLIKENDGIDNSCKELVEFDAKIDSLISKLWNARNTSNGWGLFVEKTNNKECSMANTCWALRAILKHDFSQDAEFRDYTCAIYQKNHGSLFSFRSGEADRVATTAMYLSLYYELDDTLRNRIQMHYDPKVAATYVLEAFVNRKIDYEIEEIYGVRRGSPKGPQKVPWKHIIIGYYIDSLSMAYQNSDLTTVQMDLFINRVKEVLDDEIVHVGNHFTYYIPNELISSDYIFTFPTAYLIWGLSTLAHAIRR